MTPAPDPDWLYHHFEAAGAEAELARFRAAAAGSGLVPWQLDLPRLQEDWLHLMLSAPPQTRGISLEGARILAEQLREAVAAQQERARSLIGQSTACPLDLHALFPVPPEILALGPDHPEARSWLWREWGTPRPLRHVREARSTGGALRLRFWSADWSPWQALLRLRQRFPTLRFTLRPVYEEGG
ncbi:hypothetical protein [Teichococcus oryzae]|uniref:Uncharacterized protein n=1 Tax=Teichococcus oryzae TaxID=1608942 RepID=A0A5B2TDE2_9PROT|nr:hypothetical protein [Pseudoroseomonas oryzae]KAA2212521.1 hypothetical protein F0Q34_14440 [Pseudoroseomonas oryzae]